MNHTYIPFYHLAKVWLIPCKQLLEIWNKAKYKERDALLWGDEVII